MRQVTKLRRIIIFAILSQIYLHKNKFKIMLKLNTKYLTQNILKCKIKTYKNMLIWFFFKFLDI